MGSYSAVAYSQLTKELESYGNISKHLIASFSSYTETIYKSDLQDKYSEPMPWIGMYIAFASAVCILAMMADLLHGLRSRKLWFPCKYFTLNAASLSMIAVAIKLPMDLTNIMPTKVDQVTKIGSMAFMCTMMAHSLPSLGSMKNKQLAANVIALGVLVITLVVNVCIQIYTGVVSYPGSHDSVSTVKSADRSHVAFRDEIKVTASIYVAMLLFLLMIYTCLALRILGFKHELQLQYEKGEERALMDLKQGQNLIIAENLKTYVSNYWIMLETGSPQFMIVSSVTTSACGVICVLSTILFTLIAFFKYLRIDEHDSDYKWSVPVILVTQFIGVIMGTIAPAARCFTIFLYFKVSLKSIRGRIMVFEVESYWTRKLSDWKQRSSPYGSSNRGCKFVIETLKILIVCVCVEFQKIIVVICKIIALISNFFILFCNLCWMMSFKDMCNRSPPQGRYHSPYALRLEDDDMEPAERTIKRIFKSLDLMILKTEKPAKNILELLSRSTKDFEGFKIFNTVYHDHLSFSLKECYDETWSLPLVTLTTIASSLPDIPKHKLDSFLTSVSEGLKYVTLVEKSFNTTDELVKIQKLAERLWLEVEVHRKWLNNNLQRHDVTPSDTAGQILQRLNNISKLIFRDLHVQNSIYKHVCAESMYGLTKSILYYHRHDIDNLSQERLFDILSTIISDIFAACLTNLPQAIVLKCHSSKIEKWEKCVQAATQLLGETIEIIQNLQCRQLPPSLEPIDFPFIDKWQAAFEDLFNP